jgi:predicted transcriptional regulator
MWQEIIKQLGETGLTDAEIARRVGTNQTTITRLKNGRIADTSYQTGYALHRLLDETKQKAA